MQQESKTPAWYSRSMCTSCHLACRISRRGFRTLGFLWVDRWSQPFRIAIFHKRPPLSKFEEQSKLTFASKIRQLTCQIPAVRLPQPRHGDRRPCRHLKLRWNHCGARQLAYALPDATRPRRPMDDGPRCPRSGTVSLGGLSPVITMNFRRRSGGVSVGSAGATASAVSLQAAQWSKRDRQHQWPRWHPAQGLMSSSTARLRRYERLAPLCF